MIPGSGTPRIDEEQERIRNGIRRILIDQAPAGNCVHTIAGLASESGVSRQRLYEHHMELIEEFRGAVGHGPVIPNIAAMRRQLAEAHERNLELAAENESLRGKTRSLAAIITELIHEISGDKVVVPLSRTRSRSVR